MEQVGEKLLLMIDSCNEAGVRQILKTNRAEVLELMRSADKKYYFLHEACKLGNEEIALFLIAHTRNLDQESPQGTPLKVACENGFVNIVHNLLANGATVPEPAPNSLQCPFFITSYSGAVDILDLLLEYKPDIMKSPVIIRDLFEAACFGGSLNMVTFLVQRLASTGDRLTQGQLQGSLNVACQGKHLELICYLCEQGAKLTYGMVETYSETIEKALNLDQDRTSQALSTVVFKWRNRHLHALSESWFNSCQDVLVEVDLSHNRLAVIPAQLPWEQKCLRKLDLRNNCLKAFSEPKNAASILCERLCELNLSHNQLEKVPSQLFFISSLEKLDLKHNLLTSLGAKVKDSVMTEDIPSSQPRNRHGFQRLDEFELVWSCCNLQYLDVSFNRLRSLPKHLQLCGKLKTLRAAENLLEVFLPPWECPLMELDLSKNRLTAIPCSWELFWGHSLDKLNLSYNEIREIERGICQMRCLTWLDMSHNLLRRLPKAAWWSCDRLQSLRLSHNQLENRKLENQQRVKDAHDQKEMDQVLFPEVFKSELMELDLSYNNLRRVPDGICNLVHLQRLDLSYNIHLHELPLDLGKLVNCYSIDLAGLQLKNVPTNLRLEPKTSDIMNYLRRSMRRLEPYNKMKLMVVGRESKGKSSLVAVLQGKPLPPNLATTGINMLEWEVPAPAAKKILLMPFQGKPGLTFRVWDFAGQTDYYVIHKVFLSPNAVYVVVYDLRLQMAGVQQLRPWLLDIQAHAPNARVVVVGTFLDCLAEHGRENIHKLHEQILTMFTVAKGYPRICHVAAVSSVTKEGIDVLKDFIIKMAFNLETSEFCSPMKGEKVKLAARQVPRSYIQLEKVIAEEARKREKSGEPAVMRKDEFVQLLEGISDNDIHTPEDLATACEFLHEVGTLLHFHDCHRDLHNLYFINPSWLAELLAKFISMGSVHRCVHNGILYLADACTLLFKNMPKQTAQLPQYVQLLERFEIAMQLDSESLLLPSKLPNSRPGLADFSTHLDAPVLHRLYKTSHVPSGVWSRLVTRILVMVRRLSLQSAPASAGKREQTHSLGRRKFKSSFALKKPKMIYWQEGVHIEYRQGSLCIESADHYADPYAAGDDLQGILVTVIGENIPRCMGFVVDQIDALLKTWYAGLEYEDMVSRVVPCPICISTSVCYPDTFTDITFLPLRDFVVAALCDNQLTCPKHPDIPIPLVDVVPDLLLRDLPENYLFQESEVTFGELLGHGGEGIVYRGKVKDVDIAIKQNHFALKLLEKYKPSSKTRSLDKPSENVPGESRTCLKEYSATNSPDNSETVPKRLLDDVTSIDSVLDCILSDARTDSKCGTTTGSATGSQGSDGIHDASCSSQGSDGIHNAPSSGQGSDGIRDASCSSSCNSSQSKSSVSDSSVETYAFQRGMLLDTFRTFRQEAMCLARIQHPHVLSLLGVCPQSLSLIMSLAPKGSLRNILIQRRSSCEVTDGKRHSLLSTETSYQVLYQVASGLQYLHWCDIIYKDLKPDNVLVWSLDLKTGIHVKLSDYGLSGELTPQGYMGREGTPEYQAPEMQGCSPYDERVDIFAFGMFIFEILTGLVPFEETNRPRAAIPRAITDGQRPSLENVNIERTMPYFEKLMNDCWVQQPKYRPSARDVIRTMKTAAFLSLRRKVPAGDQKHTTSVSCVFAKQKTHQPLLYVWSANQNGRCLDILNVRTGLYKYREPYQRAARVTCMNILRQWLLLGTEKCHIEMIELDKTTGHFRNAGPKVETQGLPTCIVTYKAKEDEEPDKVCVLLVSGWLYIYSPEKRVTPTGSLMTLTFVTALDCKTWNDPGLCKTVAMTVVDDKKELWVGTGKYVIIINLESYHVEERIAVFDSCVNYVIGVLCEGDQVWCMGNDCGHIVELDMGSRQHVCRFHVGSVVLDGSVLTSSADDRTNKGIPDATPSSTSKAPPVAPRTSLNMVLKRKLSFRRRKTDERKAKVNSNVYRPTAIEYVKGTLWIGRSCGDVLAICVTRDNPYQLAYGQVLGSLSADTQTGYENGPISSVVSLPKDHVVTVANRMACSRLLASDLLLSEIYVWQSFSMEEWFNLESFWKSLDKSTRDSTVEQPYIL